MKKAFAYTGNETVGAAMAQRLEAAGYVRTDDPVEAGVIITYCTSQTALEDAYFDEEGYMQTAAPGALLLDLSPTTPDFARELNAVAVVSSLVLVEAPLVVLDVARPEAFADRDNLACFVAGDEDGVEAARPLLEMLVGSVQDTGGAGTAQLGRAAYTLQTVSQIVSAVEADALYRAHRRSAGPAAAETGQAGATTPLAEHVLDAVSAMRFDGDYTVEMLMGELSAALMAADDMDLILPHAEASLHLLELLAVIGGADTSPAALALVYGEEAACAEQGLDWTRAEQAYGEGVEDYDDEDLDGLDGCGDDCDHDHDHGRDPYQGYPGPFGSFSAN